MTENGVDDKIKQQYEVEKKLAIKLKNSPWEERKELYKTLYDELFKLIPWHPRLVKKEDKKRKEVELKQHLQLLGDFINKNTVFLEIGPGDCSLALALTKLVKKVCTVDISDELIRTEKGLPGNFEMKISDGRSIDLTENSVDVAFSNQVIEHFHPEDVMWHIRYVKDALKPGGIYIIMTPHRFRGPCDVSKYFDQEATGLHLKEWIFSELIDIFKMHEYSKANIHCFIKGVRLTVPNSLVRTFEYCVGKLPYQARRKITNFVLRGRYYIIAKK